MSNITIPPFIEKNDTIAIVSPSGFINENYVTHAYNVFTEVGYNVIVGSNALKKHTIYAGRDKERANDLQEMINNDDIKAIVCSRGGYGLIRIIDKIDLSRLKESPKWIVGFSDVTILHSALYNTGLASIHGPMPKNYPADNNIMINEVISHLSGNGESYTIAPHPFNKNGECTAPIIGGNLSILYSLLGTPHDIDTSNKILYIEDLCEKLYHLDRMMHSLEKAGKFSKINGLVIGTFSDMVDSKPSIALDAYKIINSFAAKYDIPVCFNFPVGHTQDNHPLYNGMTYKLSISESHTEFAPQYL